MLHGSSRLPLPPPNLGSRTIGLVCEGETVGQIGEVDEMDERETCACGQCQVRQRRRHDTWMTIVSGTQRCAILEPCRSSAARVRVMKCDHAVQLCTCCICGVLFTRPAYAPVTPDTVLNRNFLVLFPTNILGCFLPSDQNNSPACDAASVKSFSKISAFVALLLSQLR